MAKSFDPNSRDPETLPGHDPKTLGPSDSSDSGSDLGGMAKSSAGTPESTIEAAAEGMAPGTETDVAMDEGMTSDVDFDRPPPADEGDNPAEQEAAREQARRTIPPGSRRMPEPR